MAGSTAPVKAGLVASLARPGGSITGLTTDTGQELEAKRLEILREGIPRVSRVAYVGTKADWTSERGLSTRAAARALAVHLFLAEYAPNDYTGAFIVISREHADALMTSDSPHHFAHRRLIADFALKNKLPSMSRYREFVEAGGLMSYAADARENYRLAAGAGGSSHRMTGVT